MDYASGKFAGQLQRLRRKQGLTQAALAHRTKLSVSYVSRLEQGLHDPPLSTLTRLAKGLRMPLAELFR